MKILIVESDTNLRWVLSCTCEEFGYEAEFAVDAYEAMDYLALSEYSMLLIDTSIGGLGYDAVTQFFKCKNRQKPIIAMSAWPILYRRLFLQSVNEVLIKPFTLEKFKKVVDSLLT